MPTPPPSLRVGLIQQTVGPNRADNIARTSQFVREAAGRGAKLVALQELHCGPYFCQTEDHSAFDWAEPIPGPSTEAFGALARELKIVLVTSLFERRAPGLYHNTAVVHETDGSIAGKYRKTHIPDDPQYYEKFYFTPGDLGFRPIQTSVGTLGVLVCWDQWYPEAARLMALAGADMLIYPTAIGWGTPEPESEHARMLDAWVTIQRSHGVANGIPVLSVNRVGLEYVPGSKDTGIRFWGNSFVAGCQGEFLARASSDKEEVLIVDLDRARSENVRRNWPFLRDRRIDAYGDLLKRFVD